LKITWASRHWFVGCVKKLRPGWIRTVSWVRSRYLRVCCWTSDSAGRRS